MLVYIDVTSMGLFMERTENLVKKEKLKVIEWLVERFPSTFSLKAKNVRPLKIGIFDDLIDYYERLESPPFSKRVLREALNYYSASPAYLNSQKKNAARIDLFGNETDVVTAEQEKYARLRYQQRYVASIRQETK